MKKFDKSIIFFCIFILVVLTILHICQLETFEEFTTTVPPKKSENTTESIEPETTIEIIEPETTMTPVPTTDPELEVAKNELIQQIGDKLMVVNEKMNQFDNIKPIKPSAYRHLFENELPEHIEKVRGETAKNRHIFDISQGVQDQNIKNLDERTDQMIAFFDKTLGEEGPKPIKSIISHQNGKNINLMPNGDFHNISINGGCLFVVNDETGEVDYDITNQKRDDKNRMCLQNNPEQQFKLNRITDLASYKEMVGSPVNETPNDDGEYPFYMITPKNFNNLCLKSEHDSVSFQPCSFDKSLRWQGSEIHKECL